MKKSTDELLSRLLHIGDAPSIAPDRAAESQASDHSESQQPSRPLRADYELPVSSEQTAGEKSEGLGMILLGSLIAFLAISAISAMETAHVGLRGARLRRRDAVKVVVARAKTSSATTLKLLSPRRVSALVRSVRGDKE